MNKAQKSILTNFVTVIAVTTFAVIAMINLKAWVNRSEAMRAMTHLGEVVLEYKKTNGVIPPQSYIDRVETSLQGYARLSEIQYRARWIDFDSPADDILAYSEQNYRSLVIADGFIVLRLNGRVEWVDKKILTEVLHQQLKPEEIEQLK